MTLILGPGGQEPLVDIEGQSQEQQQKQQQMIIQEEHDIEQLQERERAVRQLESDILDVNTILKVIFQVLGRVFLSVSGFTGFFALTLDLQTGRDGLKTRIRYFWV